MNRRLLAALAAPALVVGVAVLHAVSLAEDKKGEAASIKEMSDAVDKAVAEGTKELEAGSIRYDDLALWSARRVDVARLSGDAKALQAALTKHVEFMKKLEADARKRQGAGMVSTVFVLDVTYRRALAEVELARGR